MNIAIAIAALIIGLLAAVFGLLHAADPEGRGGNYLLLIPIGGVVALGAAGYLIWRGIASLLT